MTFPQVRGRLNTVLALPPCLVARAMLQDARELQKAILAIIRSWRPDLLE